MSTAPHVQYLKILALAIVLALTFLLGVNWIVDAYEVLGSRILSHFGQPQERFLKIDFLRENKEFDTFLLGSSRIGTVKPEDVEQLLGAASVYNLTVSQANQWDNLVHTKWLIHNQPNLKRIFVQVDWPEGYGPTKPGYQLLTEPHPDISGKSRLAFYKDYLTSFSFEAIREKIKNNWEHEDYLLYSLDKGNWSRPHRDAKLENSCVQYVKDERAFQQIVIAASSTAVRRRLIDDNLSALETLVSAAHEAQVETVVYVTPHNHKFLDAINVDDYLYFLRKLSRVTKFWNFGFYSTVTNDDCLYYEPSHFRSAVGALVYKSMISPDSKFSGFGHNVSEGSIEQELLFVRHNFLSFRKWKGVPFADPFSASLVKIKEK